MTSEQYEKWSRDNGHFISKVIIRFFFGKFGGLYILNSYKFNYFPKFLVIKSNLDRLGRNFYRF